jgi:hypothetical protein
MFRFAQHEIMASVILNKVKDLWHFPCNHQLNIQRQSEMFRFAQHDIMASVILSEAKDLWCFSYGRWLKIQI